jgi:hypothetical protein
MWVIDVKYDNSISLFTVCSSNRLFKREYKSVEPAVIGIKHFKSLLYSLLWFVRLNHLEGDNYIHFNDRLKV